jgi:hypothetical protein
MAAIAAITIVFSFGDHNRYRFKVTPFYYLLTALALQQIYGALAARYARRRARVH